MSIFIDTGVLIRLAISSDPLHQRVAGWAESVHASGLRLAICPQVLYEYWVVTTRPKKVGGFDLRPSEAFADIQLFMHQYDIIQEVKDLHLDWMDLCLQHSVAGRPAHDARLVALMLASGITDLATLNPQDFKRYPINVHVP